ncbi:MAG: DUF2505 domain-containing protein [Deltaproteobacteria bacterium]
MKATYAHEFNCSAATFWERIFLSDEFNRALYIDELKFPEYTVVESRDTGDTIIRKCRVTPKQDAPAAVQKLLGGKLQYVEEGVYDKAAGRYRFKVVTASMGDKVKTEGEFRVEPLGDKRIRRVVDMNIEVKIFGVGGMVEGFIGKSTQESYDAAAKFTNKWIAEKGL